MERKAEVGVEFAQTTAIFIAAYQVADTGREQYCGSGLIQSIQPDRVAGDNLALGSFAYTLERLFDVLP